ncbi:NAD(P)H-dependent oxidoreductase [Rhodococcus sp. HNM0569]|uniref:NAD(P)H-dependent oxidoreductase n=1 Tax=Rhodococcus sp. HNM0569 TaxID=2716340 RepID=UPI00146A8BF9|nr:NAD(P)H-dependent oxidoreductase [Rhodococcus sp. HNM0569]NLU81943.1 NAD(P)H-dependent oxidoreductase [Rhodococcus sp. HNM0569]
MSLRGTSVLWVSAHPLESSLSAHLRGVGVGVLRAEGADVVESDLYAMRWNPVVGHGDFAKGVDGSVNVRTAAAFRRGELGEDVRAEQDKLRAADLVVVQFPLWWYGMPAILKGWFDRVFVNGFAFGVTDPDTGRRLKYGEGGLSGKRAVAIVSAGDRATSFGPRGVNGDLESLLFPILHGTFWYTGMQPLVPHLLAGVDRPGWSEVDTAEKLLRERLRGIMDESGIAYRRLRDGGYDDDRVLAAEYRPGECGLAVHHASSRTVSSAESSSADTSETRTSGPPGTATA